MPKTTKSLPHQIAANTRWAKEDPAKQGQILRAGLEKRFLDEVDPERKLPEAERQRRADNARKAFYQRLALASVKARQARRKNSERAASWAP
jgi:hypothetical protein